MPIHRGSTSCSAVPKHRWPQHFLVLNTLILYVCRREASAHREILVTQPAQAVPMEAVVRVFMIVAVIDLRRGCRLRHSLLHLTRGLEIHVLNGGINRPRPDSVVTSICAGSVATATISGGIALPNGSK
jgi:hypothetical protein